LGSKASYAGNGFLKMECEATIMMPAFNGEKFLVDSVRSALNQSYNGNYEVLVINDGSTDETPRILEELAKNNSRLRVLHQKNMGLAKIRNRLLDESRGAILIGLDVDDKLVPNSLESVLDFYHKNLDLGFVYSDNRCIDEKGNILYEGKKSECHKHFDELIYFTQAVGHLRSFKKDLIKNFRFDSFFEVAEDWDFLLKLTPFVKKGHIPEFLYEYRINEEGICRDNRVTTEFKESLPIILLEKYVREHNLYPEANKIEVKRVQENEHIIYYEHFVDGVRKSIGGEAKEALVKYFSSFIKSQGVEN